MRKFGLVLVMLIAVLGFAGCADEAVEDPAKDVFDNTIAAFQDLNSFRCDIHINSQIINDDEEFNNSTTVAIDLVKEPLTMYQHLEVSDLDLSIEMYLTEEGFYINTSQTNQWLKSPLGIYASLIESAQGQSNIESIIKDVQDAVGRFTLEENDNSYSLVFSAKGEECEELLGDSIPTDLPSGVPIDELSYDMLKYSFLISKETFYPQEFSVEASFSLKANDETMKMSQMYSGKYSKFNEIEKIVVPAEVRERAVDMTS